MSSISIPAPRRRRKPAPDPTTPDAIEIAMGAEAKGREPEGAARRVLVEHHRLLSEQIAQARRQAVRDRIAVVRDLATVALVCLVLALAVAVLWRARQAEGLVIEPFSVPPALAERGLDGAAVASLFLDELSALQAATDSGRAPASFRNNWGDDLSVEIAQTGISIDDVYRSLAGWLGRETHMTGGVTQGPDGLSVVVRTGSRPIEAAAGDADLSALLKVAAERVYEQTQPYRYAALLGRQARDLPPGPERTAMRDRRRGILTSLTSSESAVERAWAYNGLGVEEDQPPQELQPYLLAGLEIDPDHPFLLGNMASMETNLGHWEAAARYDAQSLRALRRRPKDLNPAVIDANLAADEATVAAMHGDFQSAAPALARSAVATNANNSANRAPISRAEVLARNHDAQSAVAALRAKNLVDDAGVAAVLVGQMALPFAVIMEERGEWAQAVAGLAAADAIYATTLPARDAPARMTNLWPRMAYARARAGDLGGAQALIAATPLDCYPCVLERGRIAEIAGNRAEADRWFAEALRQGPSLPFAEARWGEARLARGDHVGAIALFRQAHSRGPRWADPLKYWGDALAASGDHRGAIRKYAAAAERAPRWGALHLAWGKALAAQGRTDAARAKYREAARLDLSAADRADVARRLAVRP